MELSCSKGSPPVSAPTFWSCSRRWGTATSSCSPTRTSPASNPTGTTHRIDLTDAVLILNHLFLGGPVLQQPFPSCGSDPTPDELDRESFPTCQT